MLSRYIGRSSVSQLLVALLGVTGACLVLYFGISQWEKHREALTHAEMVTAIKSLAMAENTARVVATTGIDLSRALPPGGGGPQTAPQAHAVLDAAIKEPGRFWEYYGRIGHGRGIHAALLAADGRVVAASPGFPVPAGGDDVLTGTPLFGRDGPAAPGIYYGPLRPQGAVHILSLTKVPGQEHYALAAIDRATALAAWRRDLLTVILTVGGGGVLVTGLATAMVRQIRRREATEDALRRAHRQYALLIDTLPSALVGVDSDGRITDWNRAAEGLFALPAAQAVGVALAEAAIPWNGAAVLSRIDDCLRRGRHCRQEDTPYTRPDGRPGILEVTVAPLNTAAGAAAGCVLLGADVTERKALEAQLAQAQKLESIGQLAAGIAHEINTPTQYIGDNIRFLEDGCHSLARLLDAYQRLADAMGGDPHCPPAVRALVENIAALRDAIDLAYLQAELPAAIHQSLEGVERVSRIVRAMKAFSHPGGDEKAAVNLNAAIDSTLEVARNTWKYVAEVVTDYDPALPPVPCLPGEFNQAILNILINAVHAIEAAAPAAGKGLIAISTRAAGDWAEVRIRDTGTGIPPRARERIFDPFFTTKDVGKGTGQGLAIVHNVIVKKHGGTITFETEEGKGTTFIIRLPLKGNP